MCEAITTYAHAFQIPTPSPSAARVNLQAERAVQNDIAFPLSSNNRLDLVEDTTYSAGPLVRNMFVRNHGSDFRKNKKKNGRFWAQLPALH